MRKLLSVILCLCIIATNLIGFAGVNQVLEIYEYGFVSEQGNEITVLSGETAIKAYVDLYNTANADNANAGTLVLSCYINKKLVDVKTKQISLEAGIVKKRFETPEIQVPSPRPTGAVVFKVSIMDSLSGIQPLVQARELKEAVPFVPPDDLTYSNEINLAIGLGIMRGFEDGLLHGSFQVTRGELAVFLVRVLDKEYLANNANGLTGFSDVAADHWATGYINIVVPLGYMNGYADGSFKPDDCVIFNEAIKGFVNALGYDKMVNVLGYPLGYLDKAREIGLLNGVEASGYSVVNRGTLAKLISNAIDIPICQNNIIQDGSNGTLFKTILSEYRKTVKLQACVTTADVFTDVDGNDNIVTAFVLNNYKTKYSDVFAKNSSVKIDGGSTNLLSLMGKKALIYLLYDENSNNAPVAVYAVKDLTSNELTVLSDDVEIAYTSRSSYVTNLDYWSKLTDLNLTSVSIAQDARLYVNGGPVTFDKTGSYNLLDSYVNSGAFYGEITFAKNNSSTLEDFDTVFVTDYTNIAVDYVNKVTKRVIPKNNSSSLSFDPNNSTIKATLVDDKGVPMRWEDLKEWDVISCKIYKNGIVTIINAALVNNTFTGRISEIDNQNSYDVRFGIEGKFYKIDPKGMSPNDLLLGDTGTFYLDIMGRIAFYDVYVRPTYAYVIEVTDTYMKLFTSQNEIHGNFFAPTITIDGVANIASLDVNGYQNGTSDIPISVTGSDAMGLFQNHGTSWYTGINQTYGNELITGIKKVEKGQFITFKTNSNNEITTINRAATGIQLDSNKRRFVKYDSVATSTYSILQKSLSASVSSKVYLTDKTFIMVAPSDATDDADYKMLDFRTFNDQQKLNNVELCNVDDYRVADVVLVRSKVTLTQAPPPPPTNEVAPSPIVVKSFLMFINADGYEINRISALSGSQDITLNTINATYSLFRGDFTYVVRNSKGEATQFNLISRYVNGTTTPSIGDVSNFEMPKLKVYSGVIKKIDGRIVTINQSGIDVEFAVPLMANIYAYDERISSVTNRVSTVEISDIGARIATSNDYGYPVGSTIYENYGGYIKSEYIVACEYNGIVTDVMVYIYK